MTTFKEFRESVGSVPKIGEMFTKNGKKYRVTDIWKDGSTPMINLTNFSAGIPEGMSFDEFKSRFDGYELLNAKDIRQGGEYGQVGASYARLAVGTETDFYDSNGAKVHAKITSNKKNVIKVKYLEDGETAKKGGTATYYIVNNKNLD